MKEPCRHAYIHQDVVKQVPQFSSLVVVMRCHQKYCQSMCLHEGCEEKQNETQVAQVSIQLLTNSP
jgi:hypothetical protein